MMASCLTLRRRWSITGKLCCRWLRLGEIVQYELQKSFCAAAKGSGTMEKLCVQITYVCDFYLIYKDGRSEVIDVKGMATPEAKLKRKMFLYKYPEENFALG